MKRMNTDCSGAFTGSSSSAESGEFVFKSTHFEHQLKMGSRWCAVEQQIT
jgi:hypothetical protein